jgi:hypothetical protein
VSLAIVVMILPLTLETPQEEAPEGSGRRGGPLPYTMKHLWRLRALRLEENVHLLGWCRRSPLLRAGCIRLKGVVGGCGSVR